VQVDGAWYAARPAPIGSVVLVRLYAHEIEIRDLKTLALIRRHSATHKGDVKLPDAERVFNPSRQTRQILARAEVVDAARVVPGLVIVGIASHGRAKYETAENSGIGSNGLTSARHELLSKYYAEKYPETYDKATPADLAYCGPHRLTDPLPGSTLTVGQALLSPTRTYAPYALRLLQALGNQRVKGLVHCSGGGQTKCRRFGSKVHFIKDNLFPTPPIFAEIARVSGTEAKEMHQVYNMGHRLEVFLEPKDAEVALRLAAELGLGAQVIGRTEASTRPDGANHVTVIKDGQVIAYA
ncbi:MAG: hypothetical protein EBR83_07145, partial [Verrucomicrobia bacterium]|nr:hypothetical protein [Verrucomicrobiota bacterium]